MPQIEVQLPEEVYSELERLAEDEFVNQEEAVEELLSSGLDAHTAEYGEEEPDFAEEYADDVFDTAGDPGGLEDDTV